MNEVVTYSNWSELDQLDGKTIENGEKLCVLWPDGHTSFEDAIVEDRSYRMMDHASPTTIPVKEAYIGVGHNGVRARIRLARSGLKCERV